MEDHVIQSVCVSGFPSTLAPSTLVLVSDGHFRALFSRTTGVIVFSSGDGHLGPEAFYFEAEHQMRNSKILERKWQFAKQHAAQPEKPIKISEKGPYVTTPIQPHRCSEIWYLRGY